MQQPRAVLAVLLLTTVASRVVAADTWSAAGSMANAREFHTATLLGNGKVLVAGGRTDSGYTSSAELYDPATNTWSAAASMTSARARYTATLLGNGEVLVVGGNSGTTAVQKSAELYDPATNSWSNAGSMGTARYFHTATRLGSGKVLAVGGYAPYIIENSADLYDPATNTDLVATLASLLGAQGRQRDRHGALPPAVAVSAGDRVRMTAGN